MKPTTVLVTTAGTATALNILRALRGQTEIPIRTVGVDLAPPALIASAHLCDAFHQVPSFHDPAFRGRLLQICRDEAVDVIIPVYDGEVEIVAHAREELDQLGVRTMMPPTSIIVACNDKRQTYDLLRDHAIPTPQTWLPGELREAQGPTSWPVIVKPRRGIGAADIYRADDEQELAVFIRRVPEPIIQEYLSGDEYTVDVLADGEGRLLSLVPRLRIQTKAGVSTKGRTVDDADLIELTARLCTAIGLRGPANVQWRRHGDELKCFEINPRFSGALALTIAAGPNTPLMFVRLCRGETLQPVGYRAGVTMIRSWTEQFVDP